MSDTQNPDADLPPSGWRPPVTRKSLLIAGGLILAGVLVVLFAWRLPPFSAARQMTDNAYVRGQVTILAPQVSGYVTETLAQDFQTAQAGQPLVKIDDRIYRQRLEQAQAQLLSAQANLANAAQAERSKAAGVGAQDAGLAAAQAQLTRAQADMRRVDDLASDGSVSLRERDQTRAALLQAQAAVKQAEAARTIAREDVRTIEVGKAGLEAAVENARAAVRLAEIDLANTVIRAPRAGQLSEVSVRQGQYVTAGTQLMSLVPDQLWVTGNFKERQIARMYPGQRATFTVDALGDRKLTGKVERISPAAGSEFSVLRPDNATGNFTKVAQRIPVRIAIDPNQPGLDRLRPGMSVELKVDTASGARP